MTPVFIAISQMLQDTSAAFIGALLAIAYYERFVRPNCSAQADVAKDSEAKSNDAA